MGSSWRAHHLLLLRIPSLAVCLHGDSWHSYLDLQGSKQNVDLDEKHDGLSS